MRPSRCGSERSSASLPGFPYALDGRSTSGSGRWELGTYPTPGTRTGSRSARSVRGRVGNEASGHHVSGMEGPVQRRGEVGRQPSVAYAVRDAEMAADPDVRPERKGSGASLAEPQDEPAAELAAR